MKSVYIDNFHDDFNILKPIRDSDRAFWPTKILLLRTDKRFCKIIYGNITFVIVIVGKLSEKLPTPFDPVCSTQNKVDKVVYVFFLTTLLKLWCCYNETRPAGTGWNQVTASNRRPFFRLHDKSTIKKNEEYNTHLIEFIMITPNSDSPGTWHFVQNLQKIK